MHTIKQSIVQEHEVQHFAMTVAGQEVRVKISSPSFPAPQGFFLCEFYGTAVSCDGYRAEWVEQDDIAETSLQEYIVWVVEELFLDVLIECDRTIKRLCRTVEGWVHQFPCVPTQVAVLAEIEHGASTQGQKYLTEILDCLPPSQRDQFHARMVRDVCGEVRHRLTCPEYRGRRRKKTVMEAPGQMKLELAL